MSNIGRCERCGSFLIEEQARKHQCKMALTDVKTVWFNWISEGFTDDNRDYVRSAKGLDGILYTLIECTHNPSHGLQSQWLTDSRPRDKLTPYL